MTKTISQTANAPMAKIAARCKMRISNLTELPRNFRLGQEKRGVAGLFRQRVASFRIELDHGRSSKVFYGGASSVNASHSTAIHKCDWK
jgi:hypothetical protein